MSNYAILTPAYGRCPNSAKAVKADIDEGLDWIFNNGLERSRPCSISDLKSEGFTHGQFRYGKNNTKVTVVQL